MSENELTSSSAKALAEADIVADVQGGAEREFKDWKILEEITGRCRSCNKELFVVTKVANEGKIIPTGNGKAVVVDKQRLVANCPYCNDESWIIMGYGTFLAGPSEKTSMLNIEMGNPLDKQGMLSRLILEKNRDNQY